MLEQETSRFVELEPKDLCLVDEETARTLELVKNNDDSSNKKHTLLGCLNGHICTTTGARMLRDSITRPLCHLTTLDHRLDCVEFLATRPDLLGSVAGCLKKFGLNIDLDSVVTNLHNAHSSRFSTIKVAEKRLDIITTVEHILSQVPALVCALDDLKQQTLKLYRGALLDPAFTEILDTIYEAIEPEAKESKSGKRNKMFRIKQGVDPMFDVARYTYTAAINDLEHYVVDLRKTDDLPWKLGYSEIKGYFLTLFNPPKDLVLDSKYIRVQRNRTQLTCLTQDLMRTNVRATISYENSMKLSNEILHGVISTIICHIDSLHRVINIIGMLDVTANFAKIVIQSNGTMVRPKFSNSQTVILKSRHPILESVCRINDLSVEPNDALFHIGTRNMMLVTGPNMGGKSVFLKQVALIQIMAQIGCFVPASSAEIKLMNRVVARSGVGADCDSSCSSFMWEMKGMSTVFLGDEYLVNPSVLYVIDEVGRGTTIDDGTSYSFAIAEELASRKNCFSIFATHFEQVFQLPKLYSNIHAYHFKYEEETDSNGEQSRLNISHVLTPGFAELTHYGLKLAEVFGLPQQLLDTAKKHLMLEKPLKRNCGVFDSLMKSQTYKH